LFVDRSSNPPEAEQMDPVNSRKHQNKISM